MRIPTGIYQTGISVDLGFNNRPLKIAYKCNIKQCSQRTYSLQKKRDSERKESAKNTVLLEKLLKRIWV